MIHYTYLHSLFQLTHIPEPKPMHPICELGTLLPLIPAEHCGGGTIGPLVDS